jgi:WD40 repeat protein/uncharacterized caspase-like protein
MRKISCFLLWIWSVQAGYSQEPNTHLVIPIGHTGGISSVDFLPDGKFWITGSLDQTIKLWDWNAQEIRTFVGHDKNVLSVAFSPVTPTDPDGGKFILSGGSDRRAILWDRMGTPIAKYFEEKEDVVSVAFSPNGTELLIGLANGVLLILDYQCKEIKRFQLPGNKLSMAVYSPDGSYISATGGTQIALWKRTGGGTPEAVLTGHKQPVNSLAFHREGAMLISGSSDGTAILWKKSGEKVKTFSHGRAVLSASISPDAQTVLTGGEDGILSIWSTQHNDLVKVRCYNRDLSTLKFTHDGRLIVCASTADNKVQLRNLNGKIFKSLRGYTSGVSSMALSPDGKSLMVAHADSTAKIWDLASLSIRSFNYPGILETVSFSPPGADDPDGGRYILTSCEDRICRLQNVEDNSISTLPKARKAVFSEDGKLILTGATEATAICWRVDASVMDTLSHELIKASSLAFSPVPGSRAFAVGGQNGKVVYWDSLGATPVSISVANGPYSVISMTFSSDGKYLACGLNAGNVKVVDIAGRSTLPTRKPQGLNDYLAVMFLPDKPNSKSKTEVIARAGGNIVEIWNFKTGSLRQLKGHTSAVTALAHTADGSMIFSGSRDGTVKIWNTESGKEMATLVSIDATEWSVTTPQGLYDATPEAMKKMHYVSGMDVVLLRQIKERYWDPGLLSKIMGFNEDSLRNVPDLDEVEMFPEIKAEISGNQLNIELKERNGGLGRLSLYINGKRVEANINPSKLLKLPPVSLNESKYVSFYRTDTTNTIGLVAYNGGNWLRSQAYELPFNLTGARGEATAGNESAAPSDCKSAHPNLYLIVVGTSKYLDATKNLAFPDHDAQAMANALSSAGKAMFGESHVHLKLLSTAGNGVELSSKDNIKKVFNEFARLATPCDALVVYFSGHGITWGSDGVKSNFYYLTKDISSERLRDDAVRKAYAISDVELEEWLNNIHAQKQVLIIDACNSGKAAANLMNIGQKELNSTQAFAMGILNDRTGAMIITGSLADMVSFEASKYGQGLLTYSLLRGMTGPGLKDGRMVDVMTLFQHARDEVPKLAESIKQKQTPVIASEGDSFPIGIKDATVSIPIAEEKPVFIQSKFFEVGYFGDTLGGIGLGKYLDQYFFDQRIKGPAAKFVFYDIPNLDDGYAVRGSYTTQGGQVILNGNLFKGEKTVGAPFEIKKANNPKEIRSEILKLVLPRITNNP